MIALFAQEATIRSLPDMIVATLGRMIDHLRKSMSVDLDDLAVLILDETDCLLELGFKHEIPELIGYGKNTSKHLNMFNKMQVYVNMHKEVR
ncbi:hypothetical protein L2E82_35625 [Cichorium intybus]|uniref:Uncharacterized protein n=1 Tax=Cichorium intybus TaxID=13427 RepID=A0ACB9BPN7_CICIN|nr:hypothetical protein L2E82_35625 [Cichorium intybus]